MTREETITHLLAYLHVASTPTARQLVRDALDAARAQAIEDAARAARKWEGEMIGNVAKRVADEILDLLARRP